MVASLQKALMANGPCLQKAGNPDVFVHECTGGGGLAFASDLGRGGGGLARQVVEAAPSHRCLDPERPTWVAA